MEKFEKIQISSFPSYSSEISNEDRRDFEIEYSYRMKEAGIERSSLLIDHDVRVLTALCAHEDGCAKVFLTNDNALRDIVCNKMKMDSLNDRLVISPADAFDILQTSEPMSNERLKSVAFTYASTNCNRESVAAKFFDYFLACAKRDDPMWKREEVIIKLKDEYMRVHAGADDRLGDASRQARIAEFLREKGVEDCQLGSSGSSDEMKS
jgi:hypothetical protein